ncbi:Zinc finger protein CONSTANS-LIKE 9 [Hibiscus syriacus]|uniref:Zinc finger protein CONSTANS-LIKE 9 n=1 Tax=Hibiscus syriacus TaxID=106335 RepID=A0A6A2ZDP7_HIBSY|nr:zinc finger protein CONSTANS-LIKE 9-like [Hibiscus syriacus]KAE8690141.1 Zinc finger protein CONSTANS-LIKE 9 [Hibiscus syriacus]
MGYICDFCGEQPPTVYCRSDAACLCLSCDRNVHSANALSKRHSRSLLCERCNSQPVFVRCEEERVSLCQNCDLIGHGTSTSNSTHKRQTVHSYSGCPSSAELASLLSLTSQSPSAVEQELGQMSITESIERTPWCLFENIISQNDTGAAETNHDHNVDRESTWGGSSILEFGYAPQFLDQPAGTTDTLLTKFSCPQTKYPGVCEDDLYDDFNMDEIDLNLEKYEELFGATLNHSEELSENGGIDSLFGANDMSATNSNCQGGVAAEGSAHILVNAIQSACSKAASTDSMLSSKTDSILYFTARKDHSSFSFSGLTGESSGGDYQDCGASSMLLMGEPSWRPPSTEAPFPSATRSDAVMRYKEKKKTRKFENRVRYATRKARADVRKRVKGRFVKAGDAYDYDPLNPTRSC